MAKPLLPFRKKGEHFITSDYTKTHVLFIFLLNKTYLNLVKFI
jgi:hypothetical protein